MDRPDIVIAHKDLPIAEISERGSLLRAMSRVRRPLTVEPLLSQIQPLLALIDSRLVHAALPSRLPFVAIATADLISSSVLHVRNSSSHFRCEEGSWRTPWHWL